ncbi:hypothetical protein SK128_005198 [Halocaridina rubra]|uniref:Uncharacterized protein n=1 Tax=Halocaridina rubra TaxID=373956 RepID=A0AAN8WVI8_HALRR
MVGSTASFGLSVYSPELMSSLSSLSSLCSPVTFLIEADSQPFSTPFMENDLPQDSSVPEPQFVGSEPLSSSVKSTGIGQQRKKSRKKRTRQIAIAEPDNKEFDLDSEQRADVNDGLDYAYSLSLLDDVPNPPPPSLSTGPLFMSATSDAVAQAITTLTSQENSSIIIPEQSDCLLEKILQAGTESDVPNLQATPLKSSSTAHAVIKTQVTSLSHNPEEKLSEKCPSTSEEPEEEDGGRSKEISRESSILEDSLKCSSHASDITPESESEDEKEEVQLFLAKREILRNKKHASSHAPEPDVTVESKEIQDIIIAVTPMYFKEKNAVTTITLYKWDLCCLESMELLSLSPHKVLITFDTLRADFKKRTYLFDSADYQQFDDVLSPILEKNTLNEVLHSAMTCLKCNTQFSRDLAKQTNGSDLLKCPNCGGGVVVRVEKVDHTAVSEAIFDEKNLCSSTPRTQELIQTSARTSSDTPFYPEESSESVSVCSEASSCVRRESDVEVISNPSISSIEILNEQHVIHDAILEEEGDDPKPPPLPAAVNSDARTPANSPSTFHKPESSTGMQESSSSAVQGTCVCHAVVYLGIGVELGMPCLSPSCQLDDDLGSAIRLEVMCGR